MRFDGPCVQQAAELKYKTLPELEAKLKETEQRLSDKAASDSSKQVALYQEGCGRHERAESCERFTLVLGVVGLEQRHSDKAASDS